MRLKHRIYVRSYKTIDGRGAAITITGYGLRIKGASHVIIAYVRFDTGYEDAVEIRGSSNIWIHHCDFLNYGDGLIDIVADGGTPSQNITVSWSRFWHHDKVMLIGGSRTDVCDVNTTVTLHHNYFFRTVQRMPRLRFGKADVFNNYYYVWRIYALGATMGGQILAEANIFEAGLWKNVSRTYWEDPEPGCIKSMGNLLLNGTLPIAEHCSEKVFNRSSYYTTVVEEASEALKLRIM